MESIKEMLKWSGIIPDNLDQPMIQTQRLKVYNHWIHELIRNGDAYRCFCPKSTDSPSLAKYDRRCLHLSKQQQEERLRQGLAHVIRFRMPRHLGQQHIEDRVFGKIPYDAGQLEDTILIKSDGFPTYHWANIIDDREMSVTLVMRGQEWLPSTPLHTLLYQALGWQPPIFVHLPLLLNTDGSKLSKRQGHASVEWYRQEGYLPSALTNFCALLGWTPPKEIFTDLEEMASFFTLDALHKAPAIVSLDKLKWFNRKHLQLIPDLSGQVAQLQQLTGLIDTKYLEGIIRLLAERVHLVKEIPSMAPYFFQDPEITKDAKICQDFLTQLTSFDRDSINVAMSKTKDLNPQMRPSEVIMALRLALTGVKVGASLTDTMLLLGEECIRRRFRVN